ncbi:MAG: SAM-dependent methyltransferase [Alphaproteobacteria bacterium]|nr:SAM-dependent methyltransferase [Alphaproteobacteria bacterium]HCQ71740.1 SAM-dependent methyltransferase [Rhodospirillaceae bacterium]|tara:strand:+ start:5894 stop:6772 length:879 start_codon:yes stop_codon:yes gene_type:complete
MVNTPLFDRKILVTKRTRALPRLGEHDFLLRHAGDVLSDRLDDIKRDFPTVLQIGARDHDDFTSTIKDRAHAQHITRMDIAPAYLRAGDTHGDEEFLPFAHQSLDMVVSNLSLHSVNDLPGALIQMRRALRPDGLFLASMFGGETLYELREAMAHGEAAISGGISPRVMPFADKPQMGDLLSRAGYALPVVDSDIVTVTYDNIFKLMHDLRAMGESSIIAQRVKHFTTRRFFAAVQDYYAAHFSDPDGRIRASFEIIYLIGWAPHSSQQKPLKPGSAQTRLADALGTQEESL